MRAILSVHQEKDMRTMVALLNTLSVTLGTNKLVSKMPLLHGITSQMTLSVSFLLMSYHKRKSLLLHYHSAYDHQTGQSGDYLELLFPIKSRGLMRSHEKLKSFYLDYHNV